MSESRRKISILKGQLPWTSVPGVDSGVEGPTRKRLQAASQADLTCFFHLSSAQTISRPPLTTAGHEALFPPHSTSRSGSRTRSRCRMVGGPDYSLQSYWQTRFTANDARENHGRGFEWLANGDCLVVPAARHLSQQRAGTRTSAQVSSQLEDTAAVPSASAPITRPQRVLHIGIGSSTLSAQLHDLLSSSPAPSMPFEIVNVDFAPSAVGLAQRSDAGRTGMFYRTVDLLSWSDVRSLLFLGSSRSNGEREEAQGFDVILDKSTTDSISTGPDLCFVLHPSRPAAEVETSQKVVETGTGRRRASDDVVTTYHFDFERAQATLCPLVLDLLLSAEEDAGGSGTRRLTLSPVHLLSLHMAAVSRQHAGGTGEAGTRWYCLSYSAERWRDVVPVRAKSTGLASDVAPNSEPGVMWWPWRVVERQPVEVADNGEKTGKGGAVTPVFTPAVFHSAYVLEWVGET
ncbi:uncharacterized protein PSFLO_00688 [Pseudozyma flocculosa]|uniref:Uncharacterized protein n=1 Tax=Pseudozyma flocculosa TaxID=84751 RepID=A0A5C3EUS4_9BASI|nr:uncharacterized protein PSFLO_00688 [Pseudozyma flocculosa]